MNSLHPIDKRNVCPRLGNDELAAISAGWSPNPTEHQVRRRAAVLRDRRQRKAERTDETEAARSRGAQAATELQSVEMQTALLAMIGAAELLERFERYPQALDLLRIVIDLAIRTRYQLQAGRATGRDVDVPKIAQALRAQGLMEKAELRELTKVLAIRRSSRGAIGQTAKYARRAVDLFAPWAPKPDTERPRSALIIPASRKGGADR